MTGQRKGESGREDSYRGEKVSFLAGFVLTAVSILGLFWGFGLPPFSPTRDDLFREYNYLPALSTLVIIDCPFDIRVISGVELVPGYYDASMVSIAIEARQKQGYSTAAFGRRAETCKDIEIWLTDSRPGDRISPYSTPDGQRSHRYDLLSQAPLTPRPGELGVVISPRALVAALQADHTNELHFLVFPSLAGQQRSSRIRVRLEHTVETERTESVRLESFITVPPYYDVESISPQPYSISPDAPTYRFPQDAITPRGKRIAVDFGYRDPEAKKREDVLLVLFSALLGIGAAGMFEALIKGLSRRP